MRLPLGLCPGPRWGAYSAPPNSQLEKVGSHTDPPHHPPFNQNKSTRLCMGNKEQGRVRTGGDVEEERVGGREHVLPEEGEPQNHVQERTIADRVVRQQKLRRVKKCKALAGEHVTTKH